MKRISKTLLVGLGLLSGLWSDLARGEDKITFDEHIKPIFREHCLSCHNQSEKKGDLALDTYGATLTGGSSGEVLVAGELDSSRLWELVAHLGQPFMPPNQDKMAEAKLKFIKQWIEQGMPENSGSAVKKKTNAAAAMLSSVSTGKPDGPPPMPVSLLRQPALATPRPAAVAALAASPWAPLVAVGGQQQVALYHTESGELLGIIPFPEGEPQSLGFTRDGRQLLIGGGRHSVNGCAVLVDVATGERLAKVGDELDIVLAADISPDKKRIALGGPQKLIRIYDTASGELVHEMKKHTDWVYAIRYSPDGVLLASSDRSNGLVVWEADEARLYCDLVGHKGEIRSIDFRADSNVLASASLDGTIKLWDMAESKLQKSFDAHGGGATSVAYGHDGSMATCGRDKKVKFWGADGSLKGEFAGMTEAALEVAMPGLGGQVIAGDWNGHVQLWQIADAKKSLPLAANPPTLKQVIEQAKASATSAQAAAAQASQVAVDATTKFTEAQSRLASSDAALKMSSVQLAASQAAQTKLTAELKSQTALVADLEAKLLAAKQARDQINSQLVAATGAMANSVKAVEAAKAAQAAAKAKHDELSKLNQEAIAKQQNLSTQAKAATDALARAEADLAAFNKLADDLKKQAQQIALAAAEAEKNADATNRAEQAKRQGVQKLTEEMQRLQKELAAVQDKIAAAANQQTAAQTEFTAAQTQAAEKRAALEKSQLEAAAAAEKLKLFLESYQ